VESGFHNFIDVFLLCEEAIPVLIHLPEVHCRSAALLLRREGAIAVLRRFRGSTIRRSRADSITTLVLVL